MKTPATLIALSIVVVVSTAIGCRSSASIFLSRFDNDRVSGNSNGHRGVYDNAKPFKGVPVSMPVLTHVDIEIFETVYLDKKSLEIVETRKRTLRASATPVVSDKIFAVDPKRAAAGTTKYGMTMDHDNADSRGRQFFEKISYDVDDQTIEEINSALGGLIPLIAKKPGTAAKSSMANFEAAESSESDFSKGGLILKERTVAWKRFDVHAADFEEQLKGFVEYHINACNSCCHNTTLGIESTATIVSQ